MEGVTEILRWEGYVGFAEVYLKKCNGELESEESESESEESEPEESESKKSESNNEIDKELYVELVKLDTRLGLQTFTI